MMKQRDMMRRLVKQFGHDKAKVCRAYAAAERDGQVERVQNSKNLTAEEYADALWRDGERKGWF
jgi:hypothetical protein